MLTTKGHRIGAAPLVIDHRNNKSEDVKRRGAMVIGVGMLQSERETWEGTRGPGRPKTSHNCNQWACVARDDEMTSGGLQRDEID
jgi:hypothetical protein